MVVENVCRDGAGNGDNTQRAYEVELVDSAAPELSLFSAGVVVLWRCWVFNAVVVSPFLYPKRRRQPGFVPRLRCT